MTDYVKLVIALGVALGIVSPALPDTAVGSPRSILQALAMALIGAGVYLGAPKPSQPVPSL